MDMIIPTKLKLTNKVLYREAKPIVFDNPGQLARLSTMMHNLMDRENGIGLAAPQVGIAYRMFVMHVNGRRITCFNPEAHWATEDQPFEYEEGCLSFPGEFYKITRPRKILARFQNIDAVWCEEELSELESTVYQHELDHLNGITMHDRAGIDTRRGTIPTTS
jgi:peptide deformylase